MAISAFVNKAEETALNLAQLNVLSKKIQDKVGVRREFTLVPAVCYAKKIDGGFEVDLKNNPEVDKLLSIAEEGLINIVLGMAGQIAAQEGIITYNQLMNLPSLVIKTCSGSLMQASEDKLGGTGETVLEEMNTVILTSMEAIIRNAYIERHIEEYHGEKGVYAFSLEYFLRHLTEGNFINLLGKDNTASITVGHSFMQWQLLRRNEVTTSCVDKSIAMSDYINFYICKAIEFSTLNNREKVVGHLRAAFAEEVKKITGYESPEDACVAFNVVTQWDEEVKVGLSAKNMVDSFVRKLNSDDLRAEAVNIQLAAKAGLEQIACDFGLADGRDRT